MNKDNASKPLAVTYVRSWAPWETDSLERTMTEATQWGEAYRACQAKIEELGAVLTGIDDNEFNDHQPGDTLDRPELKTLLAFVAGRFDITYVVIHCPDCLSTELTQRRQLLRRLNACSTVTFVHDGDNIAHYGANRTMKDKNERRAA
jgi:hypothetical protein